MEDPAVEHPDLPRSPSTQIGIVGDDLQRHAPFVERFEQRDHLRT
jgi:hypothetical protein